MRVYRRSVIKYLSYGAVMLLFFGLQSAAPLLAVGGIRPMLLISLCFAVAVTEKELSAGLFAVLCGYSCDIFAPTPMGYYMFFLFVLSVGVGLLARNVFHPTWKMAVCSAFGGVFLLRLLPQLFWLAIPGKPGFWRILLLRELPMSLYTAAVTVPVYFLVRRIHGICDEKRDARAAV